MPFAHNIVTILIELHVESDRILRTTAETVVLRMVAPRVYYLLHISRFTFFLPDKGDEPIANTLYILFVAAEFLLQNHFLVMYALNYDWHIEQHDYK